MKTFEQWIEISNNIHSNKYTYIKMFKKHNCNYFELQCNIKPPNIDKF